MPQSTLALKSSVTRRKAAPVSPDMAERLEQLRHHQAASAGASTTEPKARDPEKPVKREPNQLQQQFLSANLNRSVVCYLLNGVKLTGTLRQFDQFTLLLQGPDGIESLVFKHAISTIAP